MRISFTLVLAIIFTFTAYTQKIQDSKKVTPLVIPAVPKANSSLLILPSDKSKASPLELPKKELQFPGTNDLVQRKWDVRTPGANMQKGEDYSAIKGNQYLGDFKSNSSKLKIVYRDHQYVDGDRVNVYVNEQLVAGDVFLDASFKGIEVELKPGFNTIEFEALNQGSSGPNTAELRGYDDTGKLISGKQWMLATGYRANMIVVKD